MPEWSGSRVYGMGLASEDGDGHSPALALGGRRRTMRSRSGCIVLGSLPSQLLLVFLPPDFEPLKEEGKVRVGA